MQRGFAAALLGSLLVLGIAWPAAAFEILDSSGPFGDYGWLPADSADTPAARCGYSGRLADGYAHLRWIKVRPPTVIARDQTPAPEHQRVNWQVKIQRQINGGKWKTVATSPVKTTTAYDNQSAVFPSLKVYVDGASGQLFRTIGIINWLRNGISEAFVKLRLEYYGVRWTVGSPDYVFSDACTGVAD